MAPISGFSNCFSSIQTKRPARFAWSESHPLFQAGTADTCGLPGMLPNHCFKILQIENSWTWDDVRYWVALFSQIASKKLNDREFVEDWLVRWKEATVAEVGFQSCSLHRNVVNLWDLSSTVPPHPQPIHIPHIQDREREMARVAAEVEHSLRAAGVTAIEEYDGCSAFLLGHKKYQKHPENLHSSEYPKLHKKLRCTLCILVLWIVLWVECRGFTPGQAARWSAWGNCFRQGKVDLGISRVSVVNCRDRHKVAMWQMSALLMPGS